MEEMDSSWLDAMEAMFAQIYEQCQSAFKLSTVKPTCDKCPFYSAATFKCMGKYMLSSVKSNRIRKAVKEYNDGLVTWGDEKDNVIIN